MAILRKRNRHCDFMIDALVKFTKKNYPGFRDAPESLIRALFETYNKTTVVLKNNGEIRGVGIYQEWPDCLNFILICGIGSTIESVNVLLNGQELLPKKRIVFFDERTMRLRELCRH